MGRVTLQERMSPEKVVNIMNKTKYIIAGRFIDGSGGKMRRNVVLAVSGSRITAIGSAADLAAADRGEIDDFSHCTILPPLVDCSVSLARSSAIAPKIKSSSAKATTAERDAMVAQHIRYCHAHGVLGVADSGYLPAAAQSLIRICSSGSLRNNQQEGGSASRADHDFLRIIYSASIDDDNFSRPRLSPAELRRVLLSKGDQKAVVVANGRQQVQEALAAGCDAIEQGYGMGEDNLRTMAAKKILWIPGAVRAKNALDGSGSGGSVCCRFSLRYVAPGKAAPGDEAFWKKVLADQLSQLRLARTLGVKTAVGTGAGSVGILHGESMSEEIRLFLKAGYSLEESVRCASENGARFFNMEKLGRLAPGQPATFLIVRGTARQVPRKLSYLEGIYSNGRPSKAYRKM